MQVQCILCDKIENIDDHSFKAKRLLNRRIGTFLCSPCNERITEKTNKRHETGKFNLYRSQENNHNFTNKNS